MTKKNIRTLTFLLAITTALAVAAAFAAVHPAELTVHNNGARPLAVKLMKCADDGKAVKVHMEIISGKNKTTVIISEPGNYYLKTMTEFPGGEPFCTKGDPFEVYVAEDGYSILTMTITVTEDSPVSYDATRAPISKTEFDRDSE